MHSGQLDTILFSDLDGCLLNKADYDFRPAVPVLERAIDLDVPIVLASSKTAAEMVPIAEELQLPRAPLICENGGMILWRDEADRREVTGIARQEILSVLDGLKRDFHFRSFRDLGIAGIVETTSLPLAKARLAADRHSTEPLLWDDGDDRLAGFAERLTAAGLTLTRGGRFYHVAGDATKGAALERVAKKLGATSYTRVIAVGDSPIDQSMLDVSDYAVCIPAPDGSLNVSADSARARVASKAGSEGWAEAVGSVLDEIQRARNAN